MNITILIVEDDAQKISNIIGLFLEIGVDRNNIEVGRCGIDARRFLLQQQFDLLVLDIALPMRVEDVPEMKGGIDLLDEVFQRDHYIRPKYIVGLTAHESIHLDGSHHFSEKTLTLLKYESNNDQWSTRLKAFAQHIATALQEESQASYETDLCIVTALRSPELSAVKGLKWNWGDTVPVDDSLFVNKGTFKSGGNSYSAVIASAPRMGMVASSLLASKLITRFKPRFIAMTGICAGKKGECEVGDVILANPVWDWQSGKFSVSTQGAQFEIDPHQLDVPLFISSHYEQLAEDRIFWNRVRSDYPDDKPESEINLLSGPIASGSAVLAHSEVVEKIRAQHRKLVGIEMEIYGVYAAARAASYPRPTALAIKGVCDFANEEKNNKRQHYAAYVSANVLARFFEKYMTDIVSYAGNN